MNSEQLNFIHNGIIMSNSMTGALQRAKVYRKNQNDNARSSFRKSLQNELKTLFEIIISDDSSDDEKHVSKIERFANKVSSNHTSVLKDGRYRIGSAQKLINLYWKFCWLLLPNFPKPIHCPFDSIVIGMLRKEYQGIKWTQFDDLKTYKFLVEGAKEAASEYSSIADWELTEYNKRNLNLRT